jgi:hypothetical protein
VPPLSRSVICSVFTRLFQKRHGSVASGNYYSYVFKRLSENFRGVLSLGKRLPGKVRRGENLSWGFARVLTKLVGFWLETLRAAGL